MSLSFLSLTLFPSAFASLPLSQFRPMTNAAAAATTTFAGSTVAASSKRSRKNSEDEHRSKSRTKKKSGKRRRLRNDSSSPSKTDDGSRHRRKRAKKSERRKKEPSNPRNNKKKKKSKKRTSRKRRYRSLSRSSGYSSHSCSTCRSSSSSGSSSVSRSPPSKPLPKTRSRSQKRGSDGDPERGRSRQRTRMTSYDDTRRSRYLSQSCSTRGGSRSSGPSVSRIGKTFEEIEQQNQLRSELVVEDGRAVVELEIDEDSNRIMQAYDDFDRYDGRGSDDHRQFLEMHEKDDWTFAKDRKLAALTNTDKQTIGNADVGKADVALKKSDHSGGSESLDLESQLRLKALENFKMFQRNLSGITRYPVHQEDESKQSECHSIAQDDLGNMRILKRQRSIQREVWPSKSRVRSVVKLPDEEATSGHALKQPYSNDGSGDVNNSGLDMPNKGQKNPVQLKRIKETSNETSLNTSPMKEKQEKNIDSKSMSSITNVDNLNQSSQQQISPLPSKPKGNENKEDTGSQLQEKTFSRMHEGEVVQVSYKVYIPNKTPALSQRQLQR